MRELAYLNRNVSIACKDTREGSEEEDLFLAFKGGLVEFVAYMDGSRKPLHKTIYIEGERENTPVEVAFHYNEEFSENIFSYVNNINTHEGGTHLVGFKGRLREHLILMRQKTIC